MRPKFTLVIALFLALVAGAVTPITASARHRVRVYFSYGTQPSYYYQPAPAYYYPQTTYYYSRPEVRVRFRHHRWEEREHWRHYRRDRDWDRGWHRDWDRD